jgi:hypothetical protein
MAQKIHKRDDGRLMLTALVIYMLMIIGISAGIKPSAGGR